MTAFLILLLQAVILLVACIALMGLFFEKALGVSSMPTMPRVKRKLLSFAEPAVAGNIVELGSGWGGIALEAAKAFPDREVIGIEYSPIPFFFSKCRRLFNPAVKNLSFARANFFDFDLSGTAVILCYLSNPLMAKLKDKFLRELPESASIISSTFHIPDWAPEKIEKINGLWNTEVFVYRKKTK